MSVSWLDTLSQPFRRSDAARCIAQPACVAATHPDFDLRFPGGASAADPPSTRRRHGGVQMIHCRNQHKETITKVPNAIEGRDDPERDIIGMKGIPEEFFQEDGAGSILLGAGGCNSLLFSVLGCLSVGSLLRLSDQSFILIRSF